MTGKGKKLLLIAVGAVLIVFAVLYGYAEYLNRAKARHAVSSGKGSASMPMPAGLPEQQRRRADEVQMPAERLSSTLLAKARDLYEANRLRDAVVVLEMSLFLDGENPYTSAWLREVRGQLDELVREYIALGNGDFQNRRYERAISNWERVLYLLKDNTSDVYGQTLKKIEYAQDALKR